MGSIHLNPIEELSCLGFKVAQLFILPRNVPWRVINPNQTVMVVGEENGLLQPVKSQLYLVPSAYNVARLRDLLVDLYMISSQFSWSCEREH
jgi:hypothetical protein